MINKIIIAKNFAISKGGKCLSTEYKTNEKLEWQCEKNHKTWFANYDEIINRGKWCPRCAGRFSKEENLEIACEMAISKNGKCLSTEYINSSSKLIWECHKGHQWKATLSSIKNNKTWCPYCAGNYGKFTKNEALIIAQNHAISKGGKCLSIDYVNTDSKLKWQCKKGHEWEAKFRKVIVEKTWCLKCLPHDFKLLDGLNLAIKHAESKGGKCLSTEYINSSSKLKWQCSCEYKWESSYESVVRNGTWCPQCGVYFYKEHKIRNLFEYLFENKFPKTKPKWNKNPKTNKLLELDGYCESLKIAFEFQGIQHYKIGGFIKDNKELEEIKYRDKIKKENCKNNGIKLIIIDDKFNQKQVLEITNYIFSLLKSNNIECRKNINFTDIENIFKKNVPQQFIYLLRAQEYAKSKNGECLSTEYIGKDCKLEWQCEKNHIWQATYHNVINKKSWCPLCYGHFLPEEGLMKARDHAENKNGKCLSLEYVNAHKKLEWQCEKNHIWQATFDSVVRNDSWCPDCYGRFSKKQGLINAQKYAESKGGKCLSTEYINAKSKLIWECQNGHQWERIYDTIIRYKSWCPYCKK